jgi:rubredoxin
MLIAKNLLTREASYKVFGTHKRPSTPKTFMCRGCYFIYDPSTGLPEQSIAPGTAFADIPSNWCCPDCGTEKTIFRPNVQKHP